MESVINAPLQPLDKGASPQSGVWGLISKTSVRRGVGGEGPAGHDYPEEKALSWADRSTVTAPHRAGKWFCFFATGPAGMGRVGSGVGQELGGWGTRGGGVSV